MHIENLYREIEALGGSDECADDEAYNDAIADALAVLRKYGFGLDMAPAYGSKHEEPHAPTHPN